MTDWLKKQFEFASRSLQDLPTWMVNDAKYILEDSKKGTIIHSVDSSDLFNREVEEEEPKKD